MNVDISPVNRLDELALKVDFLAGQVNPPPQEVQAALQVLVDRHEATKSNNWNLTPRKVCVIQAILEMFLPPEKKSLTSRALGRILTLLTLPRSSWVQFIVDVPNASVKSTEEGENVVVSRLDPSDVCWKRKTVRKTK